MNLEELWRQKSDRELEVAARELSDYTEVAEQTIRAEMRRRGMPEPPTFRRRLKLNKDTEYYEKVKQAEEELNKRIEETFAPTLREHLLGLFVLLVMTPIVIGTWLCQIYAVVIGSSIIWSGISSVFRGQASFTYIAGYFNPLPLFKLNPGLSCFWFGWGILCSVIIGWGKAQGNKVYLLSAAIFGIANLIVGLMNLFRIQSQIGIHISGLPGLIISIFIGLSIVISILQSWKSKS